MTARRIVTGHDAEGRAVILSDGPVPTVYDNLGAPGLVFREVWETPATPAPIAPSEPEPTDHALKLAPPPNGVRIRIVDIPPDGKSGRGDRAAAKAVFDNIGAAHALAADAPHPFMHRTETVDFGIVLDGEITLIVDRGETVVRAGDVIVQRGTNHAWANRTDRVCRIAFVLIDGKFAPGLA
ncbi:MAG TPA: cupin domain-containing protein [Alphaproteobacteria bacterium]|nr:cupin domain-containing protein [Alphaproteobacteria bacterium]